MLVMVDLNEHCRHQSLVRNIEVGVVSYSDPGVAGDHWWYQAQKASLILLELKKQSPSKGLFWVVWASQMR